MKRMKRWYYGFAALALAASVGFGGCGTGGTTKGKTYVIAEGTQPIAAPVYVAFAKGYFKEEGVAVELASFPTGKLCLDALLGGHADFATVAETPIMHAAFKDQPIRIVTTMHRSRENTFCVGRKDMGVVDGASLRGKTVGVPLGTNAEYAFSAFLAKSGLKTTDLKVINLSPPEMIGPLGKGDLAAVAAWQPHIGRCLASLDSNATVLSFDSVYEETYNIVTSTTATLDDQAAIVKVLKALDRAISYMAQNRAECVGIVSKRIGMEEAELDRLWPIYRFGLDLDRSLVETLTSEGAWAVEAGHQSGAVPDMGKVISADALGAIRPEAVHLQ